MDARAEAAGVAVVSSLSGADADEDVGVPVENFSPCLGVSVRGVRRRRCGGSAMVFELGLKKLKKGLCMIQMFSSQR